MSRYVFAGVGAVLLVGTLAFLTKGCVEGAVEADRIRLCAEGKFQYQVLADCSRINGCSFGPEELADVRNLRRNCREGE